MTRVLLLAALALARVASPAVAISLGRATIPGTAPFDWRILAAGAVAAAVCLLLFAYFARRSTLPRIRDWCVIGGGVLAIGFAFPAVAAEVATVGDKAVILPWGDWLVALAVSLREPILTILLPIVAAYAIQAIRKVYPMAALFLTQRRVEMMLEAGIGYGLNAVQGAAKGKTLSVNVAVPVIAKGTQYLVDTAPPAVIKAADGADGIAARMFRKLDLDDAADEANVLAPTQVQIGAATVDAAELRQMDEMTRR